jgi:hypothetical protein
VEEGTEMRLSGVVVGLFVVPLAVAAFAAVPWAATGATAPTTTYTDTDAFAAAIDDLGPSTVVDFEDVDASPCNNTWVGREPFAGNTYAEKGIRFSSPSYPLFIAPGCLFWNESNSLSLGHFPYDESADDGNNDDLTVRLRPSRAAVGFTFVDNDSNDEIAMIKVAEGAFDEDDVNYDDFVLVGRGDD